MSKHYKIVVYAKRNRQPVYSYEVQSVIRASKLDRMLLDGAMQIVKHETRSGYGKGAIVMYQTGNGIYVRIGGCRFIVKGWPL